MASTILTALTTAGTHAVGSLNSVQVKTLANGAKVKTAAVDNFTIVELAGFNVDGEQECIQLATVTKKGYLIASPEQRYLNEEIDHFYNGIGDASRLVVQEIDYTRYETSAFSKNAGLVTIVKGNVAHFDPATKLYIVSVAGSAHTAYATAGNKYLVVADETDCAGNYTKSTIRLMATI